MLMNGIKLQVFKSTVPCLGTINRRLNNDDNASGR